MENSNATLTSIDVTSSAFDFNNVTWETTQNSTTTTDVTLTSTILTSTDVYNDSTTDNGTGNPGDSCHEWRAAQHVVFQLGCLAFALAFVIPHSYAHHVIISRGGLVLGSLLVVLWGSVVICHKDTLAWYVVFCVINLTHCCFWLFKHWPVSLPADLEDVYAKMFKPLQVSRAQFSELSAICLLRDLPNGATYALEGATHVGDKVSILLSGRLKVTCDNLFLHSIEPCQFVDSVEYDSMTDDKEEGQSETFQVTIRAVEDSRLCVCETEILRDFLQEKPYFASVMSNLLGKDITHKLYQVQEMLLSHPQYIRVLANRNSVVQLRNSINHGYPGTGSGGNLNGILRSMSPPGSAGSSTGSRNAVSPNQIQVVTPSVPDSPSKFSYETCV